ncbi:MAG: hypothetical protein ACI8YO_000983 [Gammaproteobacteria bacterium]|jgi:hypothetical protein
MDNITIKNYSAKLYLLGVFVMVCGLPLGNVIISIGSMIIFGAALIHGDLKNKIKLFSKNKNALLATSIFILYVLGGIHTSDTSQFMKELRIITPLLLLPFAFSSMPALSDKMVKVVLHFFVLAVFSNSIVSFIFHLNSVDLRYRDAVLFVSHIRYSLMLVLSLHILLYYSISGNNWYRIIALLFGLWLLYFMNLFESGTGFVIAIITAVTGFIYFIHKLPNRKIKLALTTAMILIIGLIFYKILISYNQYFDAEVVVEISLDKKTLNGETYVHRENLGTLENGNYIWKYYAPKETKKAWNTVSKIRHDGLDKNGHKIFGTIVRYMTSRGLRKDARGVAQLSQVDISNIENGQTNYLHDSQKGIDRRLNQIFYEIDRYRMDFDPSDSPTIRRLHFWNTAIGLIKQNPLVGVGTGDVKKEMLVEYEKMNSPLALDARKLIHNQYLTIAVQFGLLGMGWLIFVLLFPVIGNMQRPIYPSIIFLLIFALSCLSEDTLNTQVGLSFFSYFYCFFFVRRRS